MYGVAGLLTVLRKAQRFLQFLHYLIDNWTGKGSLDHPQGSGNEAGRVEIRICAALGRAVFIDAAKIVLQEWAGSGSSLPRILTVVFRAFQVCLDKFFPLHSETASHAVNFLFAEAWPQLSTAVGTGGAVDPGPYTPGDVTNTLVELVMVQIGVILQKSAKPEIFIFFSLGELTDLNEIDGHK